MPTAILHNVQCMLGCWVGSAPCMYCMRVRVHACARKYNLLMVRWCTVCPAICPAERRAGWVHACVRAAVRAGGLDVQVLSPSWLARWLRRCTCTCTRLHLCVHSGWTSNRAGGWADVTVGLAHRVHSDAPACPTHLASHLGVQTPSLRQTATLATRRKVAMTLTMAWRGRVNLVPRGPRE